MQFIGGLRLVDDRFMYRGQGGTDAGTGYHRPASAQKSTGLGPVLDHKNGVNLDPEKANGGRREHSHCKSCRSQIKPL